MIFYSAKNHFIQLTLQGVLLLLKPATAPRIHIQAIADVSMEDNRSMNKRNSIQEQSDQAITLQEPTAKKSKLR